MRKKQFLTRRIITRAIDGTSYVRTVTKRDNPPTELVAVDAVGPRKGSGGESATPDPHRLEEVD
jgi:hypothetical protein